jgi:hypothetical protein
MRPALGARMHFYRASFGLALVAMLALPRIARASDGPPEPAEAQKSAASGLRARAGAFGLMHARRGDIEHPETMVFAPGLSMSGGFRLRSWDLDGRLRAAYGTARYTLFGAAGAHARWFASPESSVTPFVALGADLLLMRIDYIAVGASAHLGLGVEAWHDQAHGRLGVELGIDLPSFRHDVGSRGELFAGDGWFSSEKKIYVVPITLAMTWTI